MPTRLSGGEDGGCEGRRSRRVGADRDVAERGAGEARRVGGHRVDAGDGASVLERLVVVARELAVARPPTRMGSGDWEVTTTPTVSGLDGAEEVERFAGMAVTDSPTCRHAPVSRVRGLARRPSRFRRRRRRDFADRALIRNSGRPPCPGRVVSRRDGWTDQPRLCGRAVLRTLARAWRPPAAATTTVTRRFRRDVETLKPRRRRGRRD